jgi:hypothetical protein
MVNPKKLGTRVMALLAEGQQDLDREIDEIKALLDHSGLRHLFRAEDYAMSAEAFIKRVNDVLAENGIEAGEF